ncbi:Nucleosomal histone H3-Lys79 methylase [Cadophora gregata]|uniref:Nucleosomal histone H3-Lys79 methylase n=1 Tax=Cadophora gregata TaxID=51156 RepID=UPI0026DB372C|nr:Nucleosomal histone H3-Lys79 methylase [Cadophora gregata]KAK0124236.1 Nucleosomal histone H3-Lys79 methylase [Cadophora gregata]
MFGGVKSGIQRRKGVVSTVRIQTEKRPAPLPSVERARQHTSQRPSPSRESSARPSPSSAAASPATPATPSSDPNESSSLRPPKRKAARQLSPNDMPIMYDTSDESSDSNIDLADHKSFKRQKTNRPEDEKRQLRSRKAFSDEDGGTFDMIHAADLCDKSSKASSGNVTVELKYPSASQLERFYLDFGKDKIDSLEEIVNVARIVRDVYLTKKQAKGFAAANSGVIRQLEKAQNAITSIKTKRVDIRLLEDFKKAVDFYNATMTSLLREGALAKNLDELHHLPLEMVQFILQQVYDRAVSPHVDDLRVYKAGSDGVYGELLSSFVSTVLGKCGLKSDQVFVDLGSGVGNVVLQAALEFGCESWGCEMMPNACRLARKQAAEFKARCRLWGLNTGNVRLEEGNFLKNEAIIAVLRKADVVLVNNEVFGEQTNKDLGLLFLDLKDGCHIISLQSFARGSARNHHDPANIIQNTDDSPLPFGPRDVSWTGRGGDYYIATKDEAHLARMRAANEG